MQASLTLALVESWRHDSFSQQSSALRCLHFRTRASSFLTVSMLGRRLIGLDIPSPHADTGVVKGVAVVKECVCVCACVRGCYLEFCPDGTPWKSLQSVNRQKPQQGHIQLVRFQSAICLSKHSNEILEMSLLQADPF